MITRKCCPKAIPEAGLEPAHPNAINVKPLAYWVLGLFSKEIGEAGLEPAIEYSAMGFTICLLPRFAFANQSKSILRQGGHTPFSYRDLSSHTITRFDAISRSVRGKVGKLTQEELNFHLAACGPSHPVAASHGVLH